MPEQSAPALEVRDLRVTFRASGRSQTDVLAVAGVDLEVARGRIVALTGESGSGKSATLLALAGLLPESAVVEGSVIGGLSTLFEQR